MSEEARDYDTSAADRSMEEPRYERDHGEPNGHETRDQMDVEKEHHDHDHENHHNHDHDNHHDHQDHHDHRDIEGHHEDHHDQTDGHHEDHHDQADGHHEDHHDHDHDHHDHDRRDDRRGNRGSRRSNYLSGPGYRRSRHYHERSEPVDHQGLSANGEEELQDQVLYEVKEEPSFHVTRALFIANLRRPLNAIHFQQYLRTLADEAGGYTIERAWLNRTRSHGIVLVDKEEGAAYIREKLVGSIYPSEEEDEKLRVEYEAREVERYEAEMREFSPTDPRYKTPQEPRKYVTERHPLYVDYIPVKAINQWVFEEDKGARNGKWKIDYERKGDDVIATHTLLNGSFIPRYNPSFRRGGGPPRDRHRYRGGDYREYREGRSGYNRRDPGGPPPYGRRGRGGYNGYNNGYDEGPQGGPRPYNMYPPRDRSYKRAERDAYSGRESGYNRYPRNDYHALRRGRSRSRSRSRSPVRSRSRDDYRRERSRSPV